MLVFVVFGQTLWHGFVNYDDDSNVSNNAMVAKGLTLPGIVWSFTHAQAAFWSPLTTLSHMLDCQLYGLNAGGHHLTNVLLHGASVILLFLVLRRMTGCFWRAAFVAAVFAIHPLRVESVAWVSERKDVLSGLFFMLTLWAYWRFTKKSDVRSSGFSASGYYWLALVFFALGLMSKSMLVTLPFVLLLLDYWPLERFVPGALNPDKDGVGNFWSSFWPLLREKIPFGVLAAASCAVTFIAQENSGAVVGLEKISLPLRLANGMVAYLTYITQMLWPKNLSVFYPHLARLPAEETAAAGLLLLIVTLVAASFGRRRTYLLVGWLWFLGMLVPVIGIVQVRFQAHADRYTYLPQIGLYLMITWEVGDWVVSHPRWRRLAGMAALMLVGTLAVCAWRQTAYWHDDKLLWNHAVACTKGNAFAHYHLGNDYMSQGQLEEAAAHFQKAIEIVPEYVEARHNLAVVLASQGQVAAAIDQYEQVLQLSPGHDQALNNLGTLLAKEGLTDKAAEHFRQAIQLRPDDSQAYYNLANVLVASGRLDAAVKLYQQVIQMKPDDAEAHNNLGAVLARQGHLDEAIGHYRRALELKPNYAEVYCNLGDALALRGQLDQAAEQYRRVLALKPDYAEAHNNLGNILAALGQVDEAIGHYRRALNINPDFIQAHFRLGLALQKQRNFQAATVEYGKVLTLDPGNLPACVTLAWLRPLVPTVQFAMAPAQLIWRNKPGSLPEMSPCRYSMCWQRLMPKRDVFPKPSKQRDRRRTWPRTATTIPPQRPSKPGCDFMSRIILTANRSNSIGGDA